MITLHFLNKNMSLLLRKVGQDSADAALPNCQYVMVARAELSKEHDELWLAMIDASPEHTLCHCVIPVPSNPTPLPRGPQVTKIDQKCHHALCKLHTRPHLMLHVLFHKNRTRDPSMAFKWKLKGYKLLPWCSQRALGSAQAVWALLSVSQQMPPQKKKSQTSIQASLYKSSSRKWDSLRILWALINQTDTDSDQWKHKCVHISKADGALLHPSSLSFNVIKYPWINIR